MGGLRFKDLTDELKKNMVETYQNRNELGLTVEQVAINFAKKLNLSERTIRRWFSEKLKVKEKKDVEIGVLKLAKGKKHDTTKKRFIITSAQNATPVHKAFFDNILAYAEFINAELLVIPFRYKNPTSVFTDKQEADDWWDDLVKPYLTLNRHNLNNGVSVLSDVKIQPTASNPLNGLEGMTGDHSCVVGHPRLELKSIPVMDGCRPKIMFTTGAVTKPNYTDSKHGKKGEFHHSNAFAVVELKDEENFFFRQVSANKKGEFIDLFHFVSDGKITRETEVEACAMGDIHVRQCDPRVTKITLNDLFKKLVPKKLFIHDVMDSQSVSHHHLKDPFLLHELELKDANNLAKEMDEMIDWLKPFTQFNVYIVKSNHDEHIDKFLCDTDWRKMTSIKNAIPYMEFSMARLRGEAPNGVVPYVISKHYPKFKCLGLNDNVSVKGYLMSMHGHVGASGSRGSLAQYSRMSTKTVTGHSHSIGRIGGSVSVGTSTFLRLDYNKGASAWINAHGIVNRLGKFQHIVFFHTKDGLEYTTLK